MKPGNLSSGWKTKQNNFKPSAKICQPTLITMTLKMYPVNFLTTSSTMEQYFTGVPVLFVLVHMHKDARAHNTHSCQCLHSISLIYRGQ